MERGRAPAAHHDVVCLAVVHAPGEGSHELMIRWPCTHVWLACLELTIRFETFFVFLLVALLRLTHHLLICCLSDHLGFAASYKWMAGLRRINCTCVLISLSRLLILAFCSLSFFFLLAASCGVEQTHCELVCVVFSARDVTAYIYNTITVYISIGPSTYSVSMSASTKLRIDD